VFKSGFKPVIYFHRYRIYVNPFNWWESSGITLEQLSTTFLVTADWGMGSNKSEFVPLIVAMFAYYRSDKRGKRKESGGYINEKEAGFKWSNLLFDSASLFVSVTPLFFYLFFYSFNAGGTMTSF